jgi:phosphate:Na+ symporter
MSGFHLIIEFAGAVALLLWGVRMVRTGMTRAFGAVLRRALAACSHNRFTAFGGGVFVTGLLQSSTATALLLSSFAGRGLIALPVALAVMLGANVGTAVTAQIFSFDVSWLATAALAVGVFTFLASNGDRPRNLGRISIGLGLMLLSLQLLGTAIAPIRQSPLFLTIMGALHDEPVLAFLLAAFVTWLAHSSLSTVLLVMSLCASGVVALPVGLAMVLGANVGGAVGPLVDQGTGVPAARRVALGNLAMRLAAALAVLFFTVPLAPYLVALESGSTRAVVNFHLAFNVVAAIAGLPLIDVVSWACMRLLPDGPPSADAGQPRYLDPHALDTPGEAMACAMRETLHLGDRIETMLRRSIDAFEGSDSKLVKEVERSDDNIDRLHEAIKLYLIRASRAEMSLDESRRSAEILTFVTNLEHIGDIIDKNLMELAAKKIRNRWTFSSEGMDELRAFHRHVLDNLKLALNVFATRDLALARRLMAAKTTLREAEQRAAESHFDRLRQGRLESIETSSVHMDIVRDLKRINGHLASVAYPILEAAGELADTRLRPIEDAGAGEALAASGKPVTS